MRFLVFILVLFSFAFFLARNQQAYESAHKFSKDISALFNQRKVLISGNTLITSEEISSRLPEGNNIWWALNLPLIEKSLLTEALFKEIEVSRCSLLAINCYQIKIEEEEPAFLATFSSTNWLINSQGKFLLPVSISMTEKLSEKYPQILISDKAKPALTVSQTFFLGDRAAALQRISGWDVQNIKFESDGDVRVKFRNLDPQVIFNTEVLESSEISREISKLQYVIEDLNKSEKNAIEIDFGIKDRGVIRFQAENGKA